MCQAHDMGWDWGGGTSARWTVVGMGLSVGLESVQEWQTPMMSRRRQRQYGRRPMWPPPWPPRSACEELPRNTSDLITISFRLLAQIR